MNKGTSAAVQVQKAETPRQAAPSDQEVAARAYEIYEKRGGSHGNDMEDWLQAERELRGTDTKRQEP